ncbi:MAG: ATP-binding cassette domain-containing protein, partial [Planctomycetota bacterium]
EAQGRRSRLERYKEQEAIEKPREFDQIALRLTPDRRSSDCIFRAEDLQAGYDEGQPLVTMPNLEIRRGERIAIVGPNGAGKTTLLRTLHGELPALEGKLQTGANVELGYLSQTHDTLSPERSVLDAVLRATPRISPERARTLLGSMGFSGDGAFKKIGELSGGQRSRVILTQLASSGANVLLLDEPTNHLDLPSREILQQALNDFDGTVVLVSHDRYLVQAVATDIWAIEDGRLFRIHGGWEDYLNWRTQHVAGQASTSTDAQKAKARKRKSGQQSWQQRKERRSLLQKQDKLEDRIAELEAELQELHDGISRAGEQGDLEQVEKLGRQYAQQQQQLESLYEEWTELAEQAEALASDPA